ncbi:MAG: hypothetical protein L6R42_008872 [Xanthoria sp. 1 TBL-2021]|nr:MAG: hypothetical protein L6R42_008872 [Xanthoria sp. 1 TBL-2021]
MQTQRLIPESLPSETPNSRKRPAPAPEDDEEDFVDQLFPAATAVKRRRLEEDEAARLRGEPPPSTSSNNESATPATATKKPPPPELDIKKSLRERREAADRAAARDQETLHEDISTRDIEALRNLAVVEEFDIIPHAHASRHQNGTADPNNGNSPNSRWDPSWNGRKNFKKFRRQGDPNAANVRGGPQGVIVPLEEVKKKTLGLGDDYWLENSSNSKGKRKRGKESQSQVGGGEESLLLDTAESPGAARNGTGNKKAGRVKAVPRALKMEEDNQDESMDDVVDVEAPRRTRGSNGGAPATTTQTQKSTPVSTSAARAGGRKAAVFEGLGGDEESDSEDELKFRFGKRRRVGG